MSSLSERLRARLSEKRLAKPERIHPHTVEGMSDEHTECGDSNSSNGNSANNSRYLVGVTLSSRDYERSRADLRIACLLYVRARKYLYQNYMEKAFLVFGVLIHDEAIERWFQNYCKEPYPDVCCCGNCCSSVCGTVRSHCILCHGNNVGLSYDMQRLAQELGIHYSWIEYGMAWALYKVGGAKI